MMKKLVLWVLMMCMMMSVLPLGAQAQATEYDLASQSDCVLTVGRAEVTENGIAPYTTGAGIAFYADGEGDVTLTVTGLSLKWDKQCFSVFVDGKEQDRVIFDCPNYKEATQTLTVTSLTKGLHRVEIYRDTEEVFGEVTFQSIGFQGTVSPVCRSPLMIEFIGDSLTCGYASYPHEDKSTSVEHPLWEAGSRAYAFLTARALGADFQSVCASGYGIVCGWNGDRVTLSDMYEYASYYNSDNKWMFARQADIVVINLGANDEERMKAWRKETEDISVGIRALLEQVRRCNPDAQIVWVTGMAGVNFKDQVVEHIEALGGKPAGYHYVELPEGMSSDGGHPTIEEHKAASDVLVDFIKEHVLTADYDNLMVTAEEAKAFDTAALPADTAAKLALEITIAEQSEAPVAALAGLRAAHDLQAVSVETDTDGGVDMTTVLLIAAAVLVVVGLVLFAIFYKPKK